MEDLFRRIILFLTMPYRKEEEEVTDMPASKDPFHRIRQQAPSISRRVTNPIGSKAHQMSSHMATQQQDQGLLLGGVLHSISQVTLFTVKPF